MAKKVKKIIKKSAAKKAVKKKKAAKKKTKTKKKLVKKTAKRALRKAAKKKKTKKTASRKTSLSSASNKTRIKRRRRRRKTTLSKAELKHFRELLIDKLKEIIGDVDHIESEALKRSRLDATGDLSSMPIHMADIGSDNYEQEFALGLMNSERKLVLEIFAALKRIEEGTYGICEGTGEPIPKARLEGIPWARYCVEYAEKLEKGLVTEEDNWFYIEEEDEEEAYFDDEDEDIDDNYDDDEVFFYGYDDEDDEDEEEFV